MPDADPKAPYGMREDGTAKGNGWFGILPSKDPKYPPGAVSTELSATGNIKGPDGKPVLYPLIVPTLTHEELQHLLSGKKPTDDIYNKAEEFAAQRIKQGLSPFANPTEQMPLPKTPEQLMDEGYKGK